MFFALWPDEATQRELGRWALAAQEECGGRAMRRENIHCTLVFLGDVPIARIAELSAAAGAVSGEPFELALDRIVYWKHNRIVWAGTTAIPEPLSRLVAALEPALLAAGFVFDRRPYVPHITLVRNARHAPRTTQRPLLWQAGDFVLVKSVRDDRGVHYEPIGRWPLG